MRQETPPDLLGELLAGPAPVAAPKPTLLDLTSIRRDGGTQPRGMTDPATVAAYAEALELGAEFPPVDVMFDGEDYWLYDGYHRVAAYTQQQRWQVPAIVHQGTQTDAQWASYGVNQAHGLRRSTEDKERAIKAALRHPNAAALSNLAIAKHLGVSDKTVEKYRQQLVASSEIPKIAERTVTRGGATYTQNTANIGRREPRYATSEQIALAAQRVVATLLEDEIPRGIVAADLRKCANMQRGETWQMIARLLLERGLAVQAVELVRAMRNQAAVLEHVSALAPAQPPAAPAATEPHRPGYIGLAAWEAMDGTLMRENNRLLNDLALYDREAQVRIVEVLASGIVGTVASAAATLKIARAPIREEPPSPSMQADIERYRQQPPPETNQAVVDIANAAVRSRRIGDFVRLRQTYLAALDACERFGELTGRVTLTLAAKRALQDILVVVISELADLGA
jgi:uncharacterized ParB-like nuclease family protein